MKICFGSSSSLDTFAVGRGGSTTCGTLCMRPKVALESTLSATTELDRLAISRFDNPLMIESSGGEGALRRFAGVVLMWTRAGLCDGEPIEYIEDGRRGSVVERELGD